MRNKLHNSCLKGIMNAWRHTISASNVHIIKVVFVRFWKLSEFCRYWQFFTTVYIWKHSSAGNRDKYLQNIFTTTTVSSLQPSIYIVFCPWCPEHGKHDTCFWKVLRVPGFWTHLIILPVLKGCLGNPLLTSSWTLYNLNAPLLGTSPNLQWSEWKGISPVCRQLSTRTMSTVEFCRLMLWFKNKNTFCSKYWFEIPWRKAICLPLKQVEKLTLYIEDRLDHSLKHLSSSWSL